MLLSYVFIDESYRLFHYNAPTPKVVEVARARTRLRQPTYYVATNIVGNAFPSQDDEVFSATMHDRSALVKAAVVCSMYTEEQVLQVAQQHLASRFLILAVKRHTLGSW